jgi:hypothetical protein
LLDRTLTLTPRYGPKRVVGRLYAEGRPTFYAGRYVQIWKVRPGPDLRVAVRTADSTGRFRALVGRGRYYATARGLIDPNVGQVTFDRSLVARVF